RDVRTMRVVAALPGHTDLRGCLTFSPDGETLAAPGNDNTIRLWSVAAKRELGKLVGCPAGGIASVVFSPDGRTLVAAGFFSTIKFWDVASRQEADSINTHAATVRRVAISPDGRLLAAGNDPDRTVTLWNVQTKRQVGTLTGHGGISFTMAFS